MLCVKRSDSVSISAMTDVARYPASRTITAVLQSSSGTCHALSPSPGLVLVIGKKDNVVHVIVSVSWVNSTFIVLSIFEHEE